MVTPIFLQVKSSTPVPLIGRNNNFLHISNKQVAQWSALLIPSVRKFWVQSPFLVARNIRYDLRFFFKLGHSRTLFIFVFSTQVTTNKCFFKIADGWIRTQLCQNHCPKTFILKLEKIFLFVRSKTLNDFFNLALN